MILRSRTLLPVGVPPLEDGAVAVVEGKLCAAGRFRDVAHIAGGPVVDLGEVVLLPGLVNAHCHLDYTGMGGQIPPTRSFTEWIKAITGLKGSWAYSEFAESWLNGARMLLHGGTTLVGDVEVVPELLVDLWSCTPLRVVSFLEMTGVRSRREPAFILHEALQSMDQLPRLPRKGCGLSPHALYSTPPELLRLATEWARQQGRRVVTHVAESAEEFEMFAGAGGTMFQWLSRNGRDMSDCGGRSPVQQLARLEVLGPELIAVHANYLRSGDAELLGRHGVSVVHCPRSHAYFGHQTFPFQQLSAAGVNVSLGTDSLATTVRSGREPLQLDLFAEMREFSARYPQVSADEIVEMATIRGSRALGCEGEVGLLRPGWSADCITVPFHGPPRDAAEAVVAHAGPVHSSMIAGQWVVPPRG